MVFPIEEQIQKDVLFISEGQIQKDVLFISEEHLTDTKKEQTKCQSESAQKSLTDKSMEKAIKEKALSGRKLMEILTLFLNTSLPEESRQYSYLFIEDQNRPIKKTFCHTKQARLPTLEEGCLYTKKEFIKGFIQMENKPLALFYLPLPLDAPDDSSLRGLFLYDLL